MYLVTMWNRLPSALAMGISFFLKGKVSPPRPAPEKSLRKRSHYFLIGSAYLLWWASHLLSFTHPHASPVNKISEKQSLRRGIDTKFYLWSDCAVTQNDFKILIAFNLSQAISWKKSVTDLVPRGSCGVFL